MSSKRVNTIPLAISKELVVQNLEDELLIYNLQTNQAICLNQTAALVWQNCDGKRDVSEIAQKLEKKLGASVSEELVLFAINELGEKGLIESGEGISKRFKGLSRREIVRKIGFASLVALPIVSSIVAPQAVAAQSPGACIDNPAHTFTCDAGLVTCLARCGTCCSGRPVTNSSCTGATPNRRCSCTCTSA